MRELEATFTPLEEKQGKLDERHFITQIADCSIWKRHFWFSTKKRVWKASLTQYIIMIKEACLRGKPHPVYYHDPGKVLHYSNYWPGEPSLAQNTRVEVVLLLLLPLLLLHWSLCWTWPREHPVSGALCCVTKWQLISKIWSVSDHWALIGQLVITGLWLVS